MLKIVLYPPPSFYADTSYAGGPAYVRSLGRASWARDVFVLPSPENHSAPDAYKRSSAQCGIPSFGPRDALRYLRQFWQNMVPVWFKLLAGYVRDTVLLARELKQYRRETPVIHVNGVGCEVVAIAARLAGFETVIGTVHNLPGECRNAGHWVRRGFEKLSFRCCHHLIFPSKYCLKKWKARVSVPKSHQAIYHGCPAALRACAHTREEAIGKIGLHDSIQPGCFVLGVAGRLHSCKGHKVLIDAFASIKKSEKLKSEKLKLETEDGETEDRELVGSRLRYSGGHAAGLYHEDTKTRSGGKEDGGMLGVKRRTSNVEHRTLNVEHPPSPCGLRRTSRTLNEEQAKGFKGNSTLDTRHETLNEERSNQRKPVLLIAGDGPLEDELRSMVSDLGLEQNVIFLGRCDDMGAFYRAIDVNILPSLSEGLGYSVVEAMSTGLPQIVSDAGGMAELVRDSGGGVVFLSGDSEALARAILRMGGSEYRRRCGVKAREYAEQYLTEERMHAETLLFYEDVLAKPDDG